MLNSRFSPMGAVLSGMQRMSDEFDRTIRSTSNRAQRRFADVFPPTNVWESDDTIYVETELPGFDLNDLHVLVDHSTLTIKGSRKSPEMDNGVWQKRERGYGSFERKIELPAMADSASVDASFKNGVLTLTIAKREEAKARLIKVKVG